MLGSLDHASARSSSCIPARPSAASDFIAHLEQLDRLYGPRPGRPVKPVVLVEDNGPIHASKLSRAALATRAHWLTVEWLPKYAPELNDIEAVWHDLKAHHLAHQTFTDTTALDQSIHAAVGDLNRERSVEPLVNMRNLCLVGGPAGDRVRPGPLDDSIPRSGVRQESWREDRRCKSFTA